MNRRTRLLAPGLVLVLALVGACGLQADDEPKPIAARDLPPDLVDPNAGTSTTVPESGTTTVPVYLLEETSDGVRLVAVDRRVSEADTPEERLTQLFGGATPDETDAGTTSAIPADTGLLGVILDEDDAEVTIDISGDIFSIEGPALAQAFAQMVWTATEPDAGGYRQVRFLVDGEPTPVPDADSAEQEGPVARSDYGTLSPRD